MSRVAGGLARRLEAKVNRSRIQVPTVRDTVALPAVSRDVSRVIGGSSATSGAESERVDEGDRAMARGWGVPVAAIIWPSYDDDMADTDQARQAALLAIFENLSRTHREHEKYYGEAPLTEAASLVRSSRTLKALAEHWNTAQPGQRAASPYAGADDLNDPRAIETGGVLFLEAGERPAEIERIVRELESAAADAESTGAWLAQAMEAAWDVAGTLFEFPELADLLAERHAIIANDWQSASLLILLARQLRRAGEILNHLALSAAGVRADLTGPRTYSAYVFSAAELIDQAADLTVKSAGLVRGNERRWRVFHDRVARLQSEGA